MYQKDINESFLRITYYVLSWFELRVFADEVFRLIEFMGVCFFFLYKRVVTASYALILGMYLMGYAPYSSTVLSPILFQNSLIITDSDSKFVVIIIKIVFEIL